MDYFGYEQRRRSAQFSTFTESARSALDLPFVRYELGSIANRLSSEINNLFLPNIQHGVASKPAGVQNGYAVIPVRDVSGDTGILLDESLLHQTPRRAIANGCFLHPGAGPVALPGSQHPNSLALTSAFDGDKDKDFMTRPVILFDRQLVDRHGLSKILPVVAVHELVHGVQLEDMPYAKTLNSPEEAAAFERPAYYAGARVLNALLRSGGLSADDNAMLHMQSTLRVEALSPDTLDAGGGLPVVPSSDLVEYIRAGYSMQHAV